MTDQDFQDRIFDALSGIESRLEKRLNSIETQRQDDNKHLEKRLSSTDTNIAQSKQDVSWVKGNLEGKQESDDKVLNVSILGISTVAIIIALIALFNR